MVIRDPAAIAALCGHSSPRVGCHLCKLASGTTTFTATKKSPCGCGTCDDCPPANSKSVHMSASGLGDSVTGLFAACGLADITGEDVVFHTKHPEWFQSVRHPGLAIAPYRVFGVDMADEYNDQLLASVAKRCPSRVQWYCDQTAKKMGVVVFGGSIPFAVTKPPSVIGAGYVLLAPYSDGADREWPASRWVDLASSLARDGRRVHVVGMTKHRDQLRDHFGHLPDVAIHWGSPSDWVAAAVANAGMVFGNDSGITHVAGLYRVPTTAVMTHLRPEFVFPPEFYPTVTGVTADASAWPCLGCAWQPSAGHRDECATRCQALISIGTSKVRKSALVGS